MCGAGGQAEGCRRDPQQSLPSLSLSHLAHATLWLILPTIRPVNVLTSSGNTMAVM